MKTREFKYKLGHYIFLWTIALSSIIGSAGSLILNFDTYKQYSLLEILQNDDLRFEIFMYASFFIMPIFIIIRSDAFEHWVIYNITRFSLFSQFFIRNIYHWNNQHIYTSAKLLINCAEELEFDLYILCFSQEQYFVTCDFILKKSSEEKITTLEERLQEKRSDLYIRQNSKNKFTLFITKPTEI